MGAPCGQTTWYRGLTSEVDITFTNADYHSASGMLWLGAQTLQATGFGAASSELEDGIETAMILYIHDDDPQFEKGFIMNEVEG